MSDASKTAKSNNKQRRDSFGKLFEIFEVKKPSTVNKSHVKQFRSNPNKKDSHKSRNTTTASPIEYVAAVNEIAKEIEIANGLLDKWKEKRNEHFQKNDSTQLKRSLRRFKDKQHDGNNNNIDTNSNDELNDISRFNSSISSEVILETSNLGCDNSNFDNQNQCNGSDDSETCADNPIYENIVQEQRFTDLYRKSLILEMDLEIEKMKTDGFIDESEYPNSTNETDLANSVSGERLQVDNNHEDNSNSEVVYENISVFKRYSEQPERDLYTATSSSVSAGYTDEDFGKISLVDNLEEGIYFLEAFNDDGNELIMNTIELHRKHITSGIDSKDLTGYEMVFFENVPEDLKEPSSCLVDVENVSNGSKRDTVYSTVSNDSCFCDDSKRSTICSIDSNESLENVLEFSNINNENHVVRDKQGNVRIERFGDTKNEISNFDDGIERKSSVDKGKLLYILNEIKDTERRYLDDLQWIITQYKPYIEKHQQPHLMGKACYLFGNIEDIYAKQKEFYHDIANCENIQSIVNKFIEYKDLFALYPKYVKNKNKSEETFREFSPIIKVRQSQLIDRLDLSAYLLTPVQRLGKYKLFLENIIKQYKKDKESTVLVEMALEIIKKEMTKGNDLVAIDSIIDSPLEKFQYGTFVRREKFTVTKDKRVVEAMVFLFENIIVFTTENPKNIIEEFSYWDSIKMNYLGIATHESDLKIYLTDYSKTKKKYTTSFKPTYILEAKTQKCREQWKEEIENILWKQLEKAKENTMKKYHKQKGSAPPTTSQKLRTKSTGSAVFYVT